MMIRRKKVVSKMAVLMALLVLNISIVGSYNKAYATGAEIIIGGSSVVSAGEAIAFLLGAFGLTAASSAVYDNVDSIKAWGGERLHDFEDFCAESNEWSELTAEALDAWIIKTGNGVIDTASDCWTAFKAWCTSLTTIHYSGSSDLPPYIAYASDPTVIAAFQLSYTPMSNEYLFACNISNQEVVYVLLSPTFHRDETYYSTFYNKTYKLSQYERTCEHDGIRSKYYYSEMHLTDRNTKYSSFFDISRDDLPLSRSTPPSDLMNEISAQYIFSDSPVVVSDWTIVDTGITDVYDRDKDYANVDVVGTGAISGVTDVPIDWKKVGNIADTMAGIIAGTIGITDVLAGAGVTVVDRESDKVIDDTGVTDVPVTDVTVDTSQVDDYTVPGLENFFPFCLPFDLIDFINVLSAPPDAPHFEYPIRYMGKDGMQEYVIDIDLSPFNSVASLLRDMECLLFIVGLILLTRDKMIRG